MAKTQDRIRALDAIETPMDRIRALTGDHWREGLRAAAALRHVILEHEERHVRRARELRHAWWDIAFHLRVSTQAAHGRWARFVDRPNAVGKPRQIKHDPAHPCCAERDAADADDVFDADE